MSNKADLYRLIKRPLVTEKSTSLVDDAQYTFEVEKTANKVELVKAFELAFPGRKVDKIRLLNIPARTKRYGRRTGRVAARRKAIFTITGEPIELFTGV